MSPTPNELLDQFSTLGGVLNKWYDLGVPLDAGQLEEMESEEMGMVTRYAPTTLGLGGNSAAGADHVTAAALANSLPGWFLARVEKLRISSKWAACGRGSRTWGALRWLTGSGRPEHQRLPGYRISQPIGIGGMGEVFEAFSLPRPGTLITRTRFAIKVIRRGDMSENAVRRFLHEIDTLQKLNDTGVIRITDAFVQGGVPYLVMQFVCGPTLFELQQHFRGKPVPVKLAYDLVYQLASCLEQVHKHGVTHRDVKPENVFLEHAAQTVSHPHGLRVVVGDLGLSADARGPRLSASGARMGTPGYIPPEQDPNWARATVVHPKGDVFNVGIIAHELLTGRHPHEAWAGTEQEKNGPCYDYTRFDPTQPAGMPNEIDHFVRTMLSTTLGNRPAMSNVVISFRKLLKYNFKTAAGVIAPDAVASPPREHPVGRENPAASEGGRRRPEVAWREGQPSQPGGEKDRPSPNDPAPPPWVRGLRVRSVLWYAAGAMAIVAVVIAAVLMTPGGPPKGPGGPVPAVPSTHTTPPTTIGPPVPPAGRTPGEEVEFEIADGVKMIFCWIPPDKAMLGSPETETDRKENIDRGEQEYEEKHGFWLGKYPVTQQEFRVVTHHYPFAFTKENNQFNNGPFRKLAEKLTDKELMRLPAESLTWKLDNGRPGIESFLQSVNTRTKARNAFGMTGKFSLPSEDQWEYAYRGRKGNKQPYYWGHTLTHDIANYDKYVGHPTMVGSYPIDKEKHETKLHPWGLYDMTGNVWQLCERSPNPQPGSFVLRGGSWESGAADCRAAARKPVGTGTWDITNRTHGFRICFARTNSD